MQTQEKHSNPITKRGIKYSISTKFGCLDFQKWKKKKKFIERRPLCRVIFTPIHKIRKMNEPWGMVRQLVVASQG